MSYDLIIGSGREDETQHDVIWNASSGVAVWVLREISRRVTDGELKTSLRQFAEDRYSYIPLTVFTESQVAQVLAVILGPLLKAAREEWTPENDLHNTPEIIEELVQKTATMVEAINGQRRSEGRPELQPYLGGDSPLRQ
ncbi:hypothetical protein GCM10017786_20740 [Amycolatopsis deserti]|uniref:Uncharacterized protein n=1 Tax=Amycolatopsis deserti TaxID=185696 RepID=A0ABQ3IMB3_9PSEU|nr:hypothetical protein [Amycolatopsis deserti]GHE88591.1 hypothetical protein GCM10017786_20740 [Amycolatopsis deserti]